MFQHETQVRVRYGETDQMGVVYYGNYALYYEIGRVEAIRSIGYSYARLESEHQVMMPVLEMHIKYLRPAVYDDLLTIRTKIVELPTRIITFHSEIYNEQCILLNTSTIKLCFIDAETRKMVPPTAGFLALLSPYFEKAQG